VSSNENQTTYMSYPKREELACSDEFLQRFHSRYPGVTPKVFAHARISGGKSSYDLLVEKIPEPCAPLTVLDLGCGDGFLLEQLCQRKNKKLHLIGVDMSEAELHAARKRLASYEVTLLREKAQNMSLSDSSVDYVLTHMSLMLMNPIVDVIKELRRVLKLGGVFHAVVPGFLQPGDAYELFIQALRQAFDREGLDLKSRLGDPRTQSSDGIRSLFGENPGFSSPLIEDYVIKLDATPEKLCSVFSFNYNVELLSPENKKQLRCELKEKFKSISSSQGLTPCSMGLREITVLRRA
jgi:SAM-dependent methyltransferase